MADKNQPLGNAILAGVHKAQQNMGAQLSRARDENRQANDVLEAAQVQLENAMGDGKPMKHPGISNDHKSPF